MDILNVPRPDWMSEDLVLLEEQARRFITAEFAPHIERWNEEGIYDREVWKKAGEAGLLCASMPEAHGGAGGTFAHEAVINREISLAGFDFSALRCIPALSPPTSCTTAPKSKSSAGCRSSRPGSSSAPSR